MTRTEAMVDTGRVRTSGLRGRLAHAACETGDPGGRLEVAALADTVKGTLAVAKAVFGHMSDRRCASEFISRLAFEMAGGLPVDASIERLRAQAPVGNPVMLLAASFRDNQALALNVGDNFFCVVRGASVEVIDFGHVHVLPPGIPGFPDRRIVLAAFNDPYQPSTPARRHIDLRRADSVILGTSSLFRLPPEDMAAMIREAGQDCTVAARRIVDTIVEQKLEVGGVAAVVARSGFWSR
jgi:hypothetical protein